MHITFNAIPISPGGGLTVLCGLVQSLRECRPAWRISVLTGNNATHRAVELTGAASEVRLAVRRDRPGVALMWQWLRLGPTLRAAGADVLLGFNHYQVNVPCPQIVYHVNLRRFCRSYRSRRLTSLTQETIRDWLARGALKHADANVFESHYLRDVAEELVGHPARRASAVYAGLPDELLSLPTACGAHGGTSRRLVAITSPEAHKDNTTLIRTLAELVGREPNEGWRLDIAGGVDAKAWDAYRQLATRLQVRDRITWHGFCDNRKLTELLQASLCLVSTSQLESFAMVALEAMARGCPPVVACCASMPESVGDAGLLAQPGSPTSFADAVSKLARCPGVREELVRRGYQWIRKFRWSDCGHKFGDLIDGLISTTRSRPRDKSLAA